MKRFIVKFNGGLGNQMFQYAFAKGIEHRTGLCPVFDMSFFDKKYARPFELDVFGINPDRIHTLSDKFRTSFLFKFRKKFNNKRFLGMRLISEPHFEFFYFDVKSEDYIEGFFQSEKYFSEINLDFNFEKELDKRNTLLAQEIKNSNSVSLHIRRGDYIQKKRYKNLYATCSLDYYKRASELITKDGDNFKFFIFSDDIPWVKENLDIPFEKIYIDFNSGKDSYKDMQLMSLCKHNVIANSSFSWWGAYLNKNPNKIVIAPEKWFNDDSINQEDIIPERWIRIDN